MITAFPNLQTSIGAEWSPFAFGVAPEAEHLMKIVKGVYQDLNNTITLGEAKKELRAELIELFNDRQTPNWDGYGAEAVGFKTYCYADRVLFALPRITPCPEISASPNGEIIFEWRKEKDRGVIVSIGPNGEMGYAGIFGMKSRIRGMEFFDETDEAIPEEILENIQRLFRQ